MGGMPLVDQWGAYMAFAGAAHLTIRSRTRAVRHLARECGPLDQVSRDDVLGFLARYENPSTRSTILSYIRCFYRWAVDEQKLPENPTARLPKIKVPNGTPRPAPVEDIVRALESAPPRTQIWMHLMMYCGLRCCEVALARPAHAQQHGDGTWHLTIPRSKGGHRQSVPIPSWLAAELLAGDPWDVSAQTVQMRVRKAFKDVGSPVTPHQLRHYYGTTALQQNPNLRVVQTLMRHASPATTARYTLIVSSEASATAEALPRIA